MTAKVGNLTLSDMKSFLGHERFPEDWYRRETPLEFTDISKDVDALEDPHPVDSGAKDASGAYVLDSLDNNPYLGTVSLSFTLIVILETRY